MFEPVINQLPVFFRFFAAAAGLLAIFSYLYLLVTPYRELALIRQGNSAAALSFAGALFGLALPIAVAVAVSHSVVMMLGWGGVACVIQLLTFVLVRLLVPELNQLIQQGRLAAGIFLASVSIAVGILSAGCIV